MKFWEAMKLYEEGEKVRCVDWFEKTFVCKKWYYHKTLEREDMLKEWEIFGEPNNHQNDLHYCSSSSNAGTFECSSDRKNRLWLEHDNSIVQIYFCPICGYKPE